MDNLESRNAANKVNMGKHIYTHDAVTDTLQAHQNKREIAWHWRVHLQGIPRILLLLSGAHHIMTTLYMRLDGVLGTLRMLPGAVSAASFGLNNVSCLSHPVNVQTFKHCCSDIVLLCQLCC